jgi:CheY-like chemotaxis protein
MAGRHGPPDTRALLAHDIRAAVADVIGGLRLIDPGLLPEMARTQLGRVQVSSELLARLVEEVLDDAPAGAAEPGALDLHRFLDDELRRWHGASRPTGTRVALDRRPELPRTVRLDGLSMRRILANLMANALRHAEGGTVTLAAGVDAEGALWLSVQDDGPGFPEDLLPRLFEPATRAASEPGSGLGLHIAAAHAEMLGGRLDARNQPEGGASVGVTIPAERWAIPAQAMGEGSLPNLSGRRVLVADDSETQRLLTRGMLARLGAECELAADGVQASNWMLRERFDLALIDLEMPGMGGLDVIRSERLRQVRGVAPPLALIAVTAYGLRDNRAAIEEAGADGILAKPLPALAPFGRALLGFLAKVPDPRDWAPERAAPFNAATLAELMAAVGPEDQEALLDRLRADLAGVSGTLATALAEGDAKSVETQTHVLLSLSATVGALPVQEAARRLGRLAKEEEGVAAPAVRIAGKTLLGRLEELRDLLDQIG